MKNPPKNTCSQMYAMICFTLLLGSVLLPFFMKGLVCFCFKSKHPTLKHPVCFFWISPSLLFKLLWVYAFDKMELVSSTRKCGSIISKP